MQVAEPSKSLKRPVGQSRQPAVPVAGLYVAVYCFMAPVPQFSMMVSRF
jgi:hypothetical protein